jgi:hypothetical protein
VEPVGKRRKVMSTNRIDALSIAELEMMADGVDCSISEYVPSDGDLAKMKALSDKLRSLLGQLEEGRRDGVELCPYSDFKK